MKKVFFRTVAACLLITFLAASCDPNGTDDPIGITQQKPRRPGTGSITPDPPTPNDSILPPHIEKWIWIYYRTSHCIPHYEEFAPPENWFGPDARALTLNWLDSTYVSQSCRSVNGITLSEISGTFSIKDTCLFPGLSYVSTIIRFTNGISMANEYLGDNFWRVAFAQPLYSDWANAYMETYQIPNQFASLYTTHYHVDEDLVLNFFCINPRNQQTKNHLTIY